MLIPLRRSAIASFAIAAAIAGAPPALAQTDQSAAEAQLLADANAEGTVTIYTSHAQMDDYVKAFNATYPDVHVEWIRLIAAAQASRFLAEHEAGVTVADLTISGSSTLFQEQPELFIPLNAEVLPNLARVSVPTANDHYAVIASNPQHILYNTDMISAEDVAAHLKDWGDLADPYWEGKIALADPNASLIYMSWYRTMRNTYGDDYLRALGRNNVGFTASGVPAAQQAAAGAFAAALPLVPDHSKDLRDAGAPLVMYYPEGPGHGNETVTAIPVGAAHPNAARLFANWLLSPEGQQVYCDTGAMSVDPASACPRPASFVPGTDLIPQEEQQQIVELLQKR